MDSRFSRSSEGDNSFSCTRHHPYKERTFRQLSEVSPALQTLEVDHVEEHKLGGGWGLDDFAVNVTAVL